MKTVRIIRLVTLGAAIAVASPLVAQQVSGQQGPGPRHHRDRMLAGLNLTAAQQAQVKSIHKKYKTQFGGSQSSMKPDLDAARAARQRGDTAAARAAFEKIRAARQANRPAREQEMAEMRNVLTADQRQQFDTRMAQWKASGKKGVDHRGDGAPVQPLQPH